MNSQQFWLAFLDTGAPEMYLLYNKAKRMEELRVSNSEGIGLAGHELQ